jgi:hypothetical protein
MSRRVSRLRRRRIVRRPQAFHFSGSTTRSRPAPRVLAPRPSRVVRCRAARSWTGNAKIGHDLRIARRNDVPRRRAGFPGGPGEPGSDPKPRYRLRHPETNSFPGWQCADIEFATLPTRTALRPGVRVPPKERRVPGAGGWPVLCSVWSGRDLRATRSSPSRRDSVLDLASTPSRAAALPGGRPEEPGSAAATPPSREASRARVRKLGAAPSRPSRVFWGPPDPRGVDRGRRGEGRRRSSRRSQPGGIPPRRSMPTPEVSNALLRRELGVVPGRRPAARRLRWPARDPPGSSATPARVENSSGEAVTSRSPAGTLTSPAARRGRPAPRGCGCRGL